MIMGWLWHDYGMTLACFLVLAEARSCLLDFADNGPFNDLYVAHCRNTNLGDKGPIAEGFLLVRPVYDFPDNGSFNDLRLAR